MKLTLPPTMLFMAACFWGVSIPIMKALSTEQSLLAPGVSSISASAASLGVRFAGAALIIAVIMRISLLKVTKLEGINGAVLGLITAVSMWLQVDGINYTSASTAGFLIAMYSVFIPLFTWLSGRRRMTFLLSLCCLLVLGGMLTLTGVDPRTFSLGRGEWESLCAAVLFATQILWVDKLKPGTYDPSRVTLVLCATVAGFCLVTLAFLPGGVAVIPATHASWRAGILTLFLGLFGTAFPFLIMNQFQSKVGPISAGFIYCFEPIATALGALFLPEMLGRTGTDYVNETLSMRLFVGGGLVIAANLILLRDHSKPASA
jgi:drug/metabolite transporter (DMT)-like permease